MGASDSRWLSLRMASKEKISVSEEDEAVLEEEIESSSGGSDVGTSLDVGVNFWGRLEGLKE